jgi:hypothetical protein
MINVAAAGATAVLTYSVKVPTKLVSSNTIQYRTNAGAAREMTI